MSPVSPCSTIRGREVQPLAVLYPTVRLSPWRQVRKISTPGCGPPVPPDLYSTQEGHPSWFPLVPSDWGIWASPPETDQDSCPGWISPVPLDLVSPQGGLSPAPLTPTLSASLQPKFCPLPFVCFLCSTWHRSFMRKHCQLEEFIERSFAVSSFRSMLNPDTAVSIYFC